VKLYQNFWRYFCYVALTRNSVDSVVQHRHLSETVSEPSTLDPPTACSSKRISPFFNCLSRGLTRRSSWHPKCPDPNCLLGSVKHGVTNIMFFKTRRVHLGLLHRPTHSYRCPGERGAFHRAALQRTWRWLARVAGLVSSASEIAAIATSISR
jgi:hypothetical protein